MLIEENEKKRVDFKLGCEKDNDDKEKNKIDKGGDYKVNIDNGITRVKIYVLLQNGKKKKKTRSKERVGVVVEM